MGSRVVALLFLLGCFFSEGSEGLTFSSRLIHRFSDEAKGFWVSRNVALAGDLWPKVGSLEYIEMLIRNDLKRHRRKLGSQTQLLFPSEGSRTFSYGNEFDWLHFTWIDIGTPKVSFLVALDTGSDMLWVPCDCIQCAPLSASYYNALDRDLNEYKPSLSTTSRRLNCSHELCTSRPNCKSLNETCPYSESYYSENTSSSGFLVEDKMILASPSMHGTENVVQASVVMGCGRKQSGSYLDGAAPDGLMGLGPGSLSVPSLLSKAGLTKNSFSICFDENSSGSILFGDQGFGPQQSTPFLPVGERGTYVTYSIGVESCCIGSSCLKLSGFQALVDSGASFTFLPTDVYNKVVLEFDEQVNAEKIGPMAGWKYCYTARSMELHEIPTMKLTFAMNKSLVIHNPIYSVPANSGIAFCLALQPFDGDYGVIGQNFMTGYRMVFDRENLKLGWSTSNCKERGESVEVHLAPPPNAKSPKPLPTNEQQHFPNTPPVSPAVAGRTSSKSSAVSSPQNSFMHSVMSSLLHVLLICLFVSTI
ncbi:hypothetical protein HS088_TW11G00338 [Tripterygium wilfordii]|uniref:Peptidase A1 domain-containing protein n=1 Tax=Tripterygium wilfordii TaxID=458696 RepID=A0A7J7D1N9_TRIWF|nr:aspartic proteinase-like protein 1 [Tripterygium wilfordii]KAF5740272.1 hypothetical protein HS088_TW11G00338 [Tripterygium wilfordii]